MKSIGEQRARESAGQYSRQDILEDGPNIDISFFISPERSQGVDSDAGQGCASCEMHDDGLIKLLKGKDIGESWHDDDAAADPQRSRGDPSDDADEQIVRDLFHHESILFFHP